MIKLIKYIHTDLATGDVDSVYIKEIIKRISVDATWFFTSFEARDNDSILQKHAKLREYGFKGHFGVYEG